MAVALINHSDLLFHQTRPRVSANSLLVKRDMGRRAGEPFELFLNMFNKWLDSLNGASVSCITERVQFWLRRQT